MLSLQKPYNIAGSPDCPCKGITIPPHMVCGNGTNTFDERLEEVGCFPKDYGATCKQHDLEFNDLCKMSNSADIQRWCFLKWCYVDEEKCFSSNITYVRDDIGPFENTYLSFRTCGDLSPAWKDLTKELMREVFSEIEVTVVVPGSEFPFNYIELENGDHAPFNVPQDLLKNSTFQGAFIDYMDVLKGLMGLKGMKVVLPTTDGRKDQSMYDAAVNSVTKSLTDVGMSNFWITSKRLRDVSFTIPLYTSELYIYELNKETQTSLLLSLTNTFKPFHYTLCIMTVCIVFIIGLLPMFFSSSRDESCDFNQVFENDKWKKASFPRRCIIVTRILVDPLFQTFVDCFGGSTEDHTSSSTLPRKFVTVGFAFFILILQASYTANLASFLTRKNLGIFVRSIDEAIKDGKRICTPAVIVDEMKARHEKSKDETFVPVGYSRFLQQSINYMKEDKCDIFIGEHIAIMTGSDNSDICNGNKPIISSIQASALKIDVAFPIQDKYASTLSRSMMQLQSSSLEFERFLDPYMKTFDCQIYVQEGNNLVGNEALTLTDISFPMIVLFICMILGVCFKLAKRYRLFSVRKELPFQKPH